MKPSEPLIDFVHSFHHHFKGGIFWINGRTNYHIEASTSYIEKAGYNIIGLVIVLVSIIINANLTLDWMLDWTLDWTLK